MKRSDPAKPSRFGAHLRRLRANAGLTQEELAARAGLSARGVSDLERGLRSPRATTLNRLAEGLELPPSELEGSTEVGQSHEDPPPHPHMSIPSPLTPFLGRQDDVARVHALLAQPDVRLVTLTGTGGVGKTRVALQVAHAMAEHVEDSIVFVDLAPLSDSQLVLPTIARSLGVQGVAGSLLMGQIVRAVGDRDVLIVIDNFEHVIEAAVDLPALLARCPAVTILATSRERLHLNAEQEYPLSPLPVPEYPYGLFVDDLCAFDAIRLFVQRAQAVQPAFQLSDGNAAAVVDICNRVDGLPLAIKLAAAWSKVFPPAALAAQLEHALPILTGGGRDHPDRQQTMRTTIAWSYELLDPVERWYFRRLAVFTGGFTLDAFEVMCGPLASPGPGPLAVLASLVDKSLVRVESTAGDTPRYFMLETIREFAFEQLIDSGEETEARTRHADWCLMFAEDIVPKLRPILRPAVFARIEAEHANLRAALSWLDGQGQRRELAKLASSLGWFWYLLGHYHEGLGWLKRAIGPQGDEVTPAHVQAFLSAGHLALAVGNPAAETYLQQARRLARESRDAGREAKVVMLLGIMAKDCGDYLHAESLFVAAQTLLDKTDDPWDPLVADFHFGVIAYGMGHLDNAVPKLEGVKSASREIGDPLLPSWCNSFLALIACKQRDIGQATALVREMQQPNLQLAVIMATKAIWARWPCSRMRLASPAPQPGCLALRRLPTLT